VQKQRLENIMSNRFHSKYHRTNHHTLSSLTNPDAGHDPIASADQPFQGDFYINGAIKHVASNINEDVNKTTAANFAGNVGIGTDNPSSKLTIVCNTTANAIEIDQTGTGNAFIVNNPVNSFASFVIDKYGNLGIGTRTAAVNTNSKIQIYGDLSFYLPNSYILGNSYYDLNTGYRRYASAGTIGAIKLASINNNRSISFYYAPPGIPANTPTLQEAMFIDGSGNVSIGYSGALTKKLTIGGDTNVNGDLTISGDLYVNGGALPTTYYVFLSSNDNTSIVDSVNLTDISSYNALIQPGTYKVEGLTFIQPTSSLGINLGVTYTGTTAWASLLETFGQTDVLAVSSNRISYTTLPATNTNLVTTTNNSIYTYELKGTINVTTAGYFKYNASNNSAGTQTLNFLKGSTLTLTKIA
jgi:hypothetical protein